MYTRGITHGTSEFILRLHITTGYAEKCVNSQLFCCCVNGLRPQSDRPRGHGTGHSLHMLSWCNQEMKQTVEVPQVKWQTLLANFSVRRKGVHNNDKKNRDHIVNTNSSTGTCYHYPSITYNVIVCANCVRKCVCGWQHYRLIYPSPPQTPKWHILPWC